MVEVKSKILDVIGCSDHVVCVKFPVREVNHCGASALQCRVGSQACEEEYFHLLWLNRHPHFEAPGVAVRITLPEFLFHCVIHGASGEDVAIVNIHHVTV